ncbi:unknown [Clostridium sp. CAG:557]|jgi:hypothetical protein|nr:unknown [Clostridium sp. CAG:557]
MANEKDLNKVNTKEKQVVAGGLVYEFIKDGKHCYLCRF